MFVLGGLFVALSLVVRSSQFGLEELNHLAVLDMCLARRLL